MAVLASHAPLYDLPRTDALDVRLAPLSGEEALRLLSERARDARLDEDPETARRLVDLCGGLPLLLEAGHSSCGATRCAVWCGCWTSSAGTCARPVAETLAREIAEELRSWVDTATMVHVGTFETRRDDDG
ncbi:hypothetical protein ACWD26_21905 [Streptomyces sp. NPDC002787]